MYNRPEPDGTYPHDYGWSRVKHLGGSYEGGKESYEKGTTAANKILKEHLGIEVDLHHWLNKAFLVYEIKNGKMKAIYEHDWAWYIIENVRTDVLQRLYDQRKENLSRALHFLADEQDRLAQGDIHTEQRHVDNAERAVSFAAHMLTMMPEPSRLTGRF